MGGRYEVPLNWCDNNVNLPDRFAAAARRLEFLEKRLGRDPELAANYEKSIDMDMEKGYIKRLTEEEANGTFLITLSSTLRNLVRFDEYVMLLQSFKAHH